MGKIETFQDLVAWKVAHTFVLEIYQNTRTFPADERFGLVSQMRRAAVSISSNIAEGFGRRTMKEKDRFYDMALASLSEVRNQLIVSRDMGFLSEKSYMELFHRSDSVGKLLNGLLRSSTDRPSA